MRIASSGPNPSDKEKPSRSEHHEIASVEERSLDPDHEPRKEGTHKMKQSPSVIEIGQNDMFSDGASLGGDGERS